LINSSLYIFGAAALLAGSIAFYPGLGDNLTCNGVTPCALGQYLYIGGTLAICFALLWVSSCYVDVFKSDNSLPTIISWPIFFIEYHTIFFSQDIGRLLRSGNVIPYPYIIALFSALVGAVNFNYGANFLMPQYLTHPDYVEKGALFFVVGGICFMIHALAVCAAYLF
jgi:hypothetical protein